LRIFRYLRVKKLIKKLFDFYIKSSIHVALAVVSLGYISMSIALDTVNISLLIFIFSSAVVAYNFTKYSASIPFTRAIFKQVIFWVTVTAFLLSVFLFLDLTFLAQIITLTGGILVGLYSIPFHSKSENLRNSKGGKIYLVIISWILLTVGVPLAMNPTFNLVLFLKLFLLQGVYILVAILPFDIRDLNIDESRLQTLPQRLGIRKVKRLGMGLLTLGVLFCGLSFGFFNPFGLSTAISFVILALFLFFCKPTQSRYYTSFWVEAIPIIWALSFIYLLNFNDLLFRQTNF